MQSLNLQLVNFFLNICQSAQSYSDTMSFDLNSILVSLPDLNPRLSMYVGNLKHESFFHILENFHFMIKDCDKIGKVTKKNKEVLVQFHPVKSGNQLDYLLLCCLCNEKSSLDAKSEMYQCSLQKDYITQERSSYCIHCQAIEKFEPCNSFPLHAGLFPFKFSNDYVSIQDISEKPFLSAVFASGCYGLIRKPRKNLKCWSQLCKDVWNCSHIDTWNTHEKQGTEGGKEKEVVLEDFEFLELEQLASIKMVKDVNVHVQQPRRIAIPLTSEIQDKFRLLARGGYQYSARTEFQPKFDPSQACKPHKSLFKKTLSFLSKNVLIYGSEWIEQKERTIYYRWVILILL